ncbi:MAG: alpha-glucosidase [Neolewinella sp.]|jgi:alpha-glucosidase
MAKLKKKVTLPYAPDEHLTKSTVALGTDRFDDVYYEHDTGKITGITQEGKHKFVVKSKGKGQLRLEIWNDSVVRLRFTVGDPGRDFSYAVSDEAQPQDAKVKMKEQNTQYLITTATLKIKIAKADGQISITDKDTDKVVHEFAAPFYGRSTLNQGLEQVRIQLKTNTSEAIYGLGDKAWDTNLQGSDWANWNEDSFAFGRQHKTIYRSIPFYYGLHEGAAYGIFLDNTYKTHFDFNSRKDGLTTIWADGGEFDYYFINGPQLNDVAARYHHLTGMPELPPIWAMGYHQCRWSYYPESRVRELAQTFRDKKVPCDAIYLDIDYMDGYRCFTWNKEYFPDPKGMIADLKKDGFHTVVMIDPGIKVDKDYHVYAEGMEEDVFCRRGSGELMVGPVWPLECVWPDFTDPYVRDWWGPLYKELYVDQGVSGFWNDMNEPAVFKVNHLTFPDDVSHNFDGDPTNHKKAHNIYGMQMTRASYDGLKALKPAKRPFLLGRASFSGGQRYAALWTGDNIASWEHLQIANRQCIRMAISGYSMVGTDIGGFVDNPTPEMMTRWLQLAVFHPVMRVHSMGNNCDGAAEVEADAIKKAEQENRQDQEPWVHGKTHTKYNRKAIEMRYQLLPYLYSSFRHHLKTGIPVLRNLFFYDQTDANCLKHGDQFLYGEDLMIAPVLKEGQTKMYVYLPKGEWYDFWTGDFHKGKKKISVKVKPDRIPVFVRAGATLPTIEVVQSTAEMRKLDNLELSVFLAKEGTSTFYWDAGEGYGYEAEQYTERTYTIKRDSKKISLTQSIVGDYNASFRTAQIRLVGLTQPPTSFTVDGKRKTAGIFYGKRAVVITVPIDFSEITIG